MNEENTFLEELEDTLEESASAEAGESSTPVEDFSFWLKDLANCASFRGNIVFLDRSGANVMAADTSEAISSKGKCRDMAQTCIDKVIHEARQKIDVRTSISGSGSFCQEFRQRFDRRLDALREKLEVLRTPENTAVVDELEDYLTASEIHKKAKEIYPPDTSFKPPAPITTQSAMMYGTLPIMRKVLPNSLLRALCGMGSTAIRPFGTSKLTRRPPLTDSRPLSTNRCRMKFWREL